MDVLIGACADLADVITVFRGDPSLGELAELMREAQIVLDGHTRMDAALLASAPQLRSIVFLGSGASSMSI